MNLIFLIVPFKRLRSGLNHSCLIYHDNKIHCWGKHEYDKTSIPDTFNENALTFSLGFFHTCGILANNNSVTCWGENYNFYLDMDSNSSLHAKKVQNGPGQAEFKIPTLTNNDSLELSSYSKYNCVITKINRKLICWGQYDTNLNNLTIPKVIDESTTIQVSVGYNHICTISTSLSDSFIDRKLICWGNNTFNQCDVNKYYQQGVRYVETSGFNVCAISATKWLECWGREIYGVNEIPLQQRDYVEWVGVYLNQGCLIGRYNQLFCFGSNEFGVRDIPNGMLIDSIEVDLGYGFMCSLFIDKLVMDEKVKCWGLNNEGQCNVENMVIQSRS